MDERDAFEKNRARRSRPASIRPGFAVEQAAELDERIAAKQGRASVRASQARQMNEMEENLAAKTRGSAAPGGRYRSTQLNHLEQDVAAKTRASAGRTDPRMTQLEQDVATKHSAHWGGNAAQGLSLLEDRVEAKTKRATSSRLLQPPRTGPAQSRSRTQLGSHEDSVSMRSREVTHGENRFAGSGGSGRQLDDNSDFSKNFSSTSQGRMQAFYDDDMIKPGEVPPSPGKGFEGRENDPAPTTTVAHGIANEPGVEYGIYSTDGHGFGDSLAVAVAVAEDEDEAFIPAAIEFDPDSKPPIYKNRRFRFYLIAATILLAAVGVGAALTVTTARNKQNTAPTASPTTAREGLDIGQQIIAVVGEASLADPKSPSARAADWIINEDPMQLLPEADNLIQRYLLVQFYLATTEDRPWLACNPPIADENNTCVFPRLAQVYPEITYENITWGRWLSDSHECSWAGILCDEFNQTRAIELAGQQIRGTLPTEIALVPYLQSLTLNWNELYGTLPSELASMKHLLNIELHYNFFTGQVPPQWYTAQALQRINYAGNYLSGTIPTEIGLLSTMKGFFSFENSIGGSLPTEVGQMKFLSFTRMGRNFMVGTLPSEVGNLEKLQEFWIHRNQLSGEMPSEMGNMRDLGDLRLHYNLLSGTVPVEHYKMPQLRRWDLYDMNLTSTISTTIGSMAKLETYRIRANNFYGNIPTELGLITGLDELWLHYNNLVGTVPIQLCTLRGPQGIKILDVDCGPTNSFGPPLLECMLECCTACCDSITGFCNRENVGGVEEIGHGNRHLT